MLLNVAHRPVTPEDIPVISELHNRVFGPGRFARTAYRVREQIGSGVELSRFCRIAEKDGRVIAALRMTDVSIGGKKGPLLLGPIVVDPSFTNQGYGRALIGDVMDQARAAGIPLVVLVGDESYYGRFGFKPVKPGHITFPGPVNAARVLAAELQPGALENFRGCVSGS
jgi:predicted N-acetyltransferase YhbS